MPWVMVCDDTLSVAAVDSEFATSVDPMGGRRDLRRLGQVRPSVAAAKAALLHGRRRSEFPDVMLIDMWLTGEDGRPARQGIELMHWITATFGDARPICVLHSGELTPNGAHEFCLAGGHHAFNSVRIPRWSDRLRVVWSAIDGTRWRPTPHPPRVHPSDEERILLPYLEAGCTNSEIRNALDWDREHLYYVKRGLYDRLRATELIDTKYEASLTTSIAAAASRGGVVWVSFPVRKTHAR